MLSLPGNRTLCRKFAIISIQHLRWIEITTGGLSTNQTMKDEPATNIINPNWILLDTCSTIISIRENIFRRIQPCDVEEEIRAYKNGGQQDYDYTVTLEMSPFKVFLMSNPLRTYSPLLHW